jgi:hypothetical protein
MMGLRWNAALPAGFGSLMKPCRAAWQKNTRLLLAAMKRMIFTVI